MADSDTQQAAVAEPTTREQKKPAGARPRPLKQPPYNVILHDDDDHSYDYVIEMLGKLFGHNQTKAFLMAVEVDTTGRVIVDTTTLERAELKRDQIHAYGPDPLIKRCQGSMTATIEPATDS